MNPGSPSTSVKEIEARQSLVSFFYSRPHLRDDLCKCLTNLEDVPRIVQKLLLRRGDAGDLASIHSAIGVWKSIKERLDLEKKMERQEQLNVQSDEWASIDALMSRMKDLQELSRRISFALHGYSTEEPSEIISTDGVSTGLQGSLQLTWRYGQNKWAIAPE
jgi:DNA mismatch repair ATPase MutS